tara:strand:- start:808 stop:1233 length:426 start_codon:yes stop_codon:yes gene_type:complete
LKNIKLHKMGDITFMKAIKDSKNLKQGKATNAKEMLEEKYPVMTSEFKRIQEEQYDLFCKKQLDYGPGNISVGTQLLNEEEIKLSLTGLWFRMNDKIQRLKTMLLDGRAAAVKDEPMEDAYLDVSNYGIMATIVKNGKWGK